MTFGLKVYSAEGTVVMDSTIRNRFTLRGRVICRRYTNPHGGEQLWQAYIPPNVTPGTHTLALKLTTSDITFVGRIMTGETTGRENDPRLLFKADAAPEIYVYSTEKVPVDSGFGLTTWDSKGEPTFSSGRQGQLLQVREVGSTTGYVASAADAANGILISSLPYAYSGYYATTGAVLAVMDTVAFRLVNGRPTASKATIRSMFSPGNDNYMRHWANKSHNRLHVSTVKLPDYTVPTLTWS